MRVLLIEDDPMIGASLQSRLGHAGMAVDWVTNGADALDALAADGYGLVLLDLGLPDRPGLGVLEALRRRKSRIPVLIVSARDEVGAQVAGLDLGADDYIVKPFEFDMLMARIRAVLRRQAGHAESKIVVGDITLDLASHEVAYRGLSQLLPAREFALLHALAERPGGDPVTPPA